MSFPFANILVLTGPTGSGKTRLGIELALALDAEIVSMDSMALYRRMDIGTAKPSLEERQRVRHHLIDVLEPWESASVAWWLNQAAECVRDIEARGKQALFVGGTPLYLKALLRGLFSGPAADPALRGQLTREAQAHGSAALHERLARIDPASAGRIHPHDLRRIIRALEVFELTGQPISAWQTQWPLTSTPPHPALSPRERGDGAILCLDMPRADLYERIDRRVEAMFAAGLLDEVKSLRGLVKQPSPEAAQALGYKEVGAYLDGRFGWQQTIEQVKIRSRQFAKRQLSWFRHLPECQPATSELTWTLWKPKMKV